MRNFSVVSCFLLLHFIFHVLIKFFTLYHFSFFLSIWCLCRKEKECTYIGKKKIRHQLSGRPFLHYISIQTSSSNKFHCKCAFSIGYLIFFFFFWFSFHCYKIVSVVSLFFSSFYFNFSHFYNSVLFFVMFLILVSYAYFPFWFFFSFPYFLI